MHTGNIVQDLQQLQASSNCFCQLMYHDVCFCKDYCSFDFVLVCNVILNYFNVPGVLNICISFLSITLDCESGTYKKETLLIDMLTVVVEVKQSFIH